MTPQLENGYTRIANEFLNNLGCFRIPGEIRLLFDVIIRQTWGFQKKDDYISLDQFVEKTGLKKSAVVRGLTKLLIHNLINKTVNERGCKYSIQKDYKEWVSFTKVLMKINKTVNLPLTEVLPTKEKTKETIKDTGIASPDNYKKYQDRKKQLLYQMGTQNKVVTQGQEEALRIAEQLKINLDEACQVDATLRGRWFKFFKDTILNKQRGTIQIVYSYWSDSPTFQALTSDQKIKMFFWKFYNPQFEVKT